MTILVMVLMMTTTFFTVNCVTHKAACRFFEGNRSTPAPREIRTNSARKIGIGA